MVSEIFFLWGSVDNENNRQIKEQIKDELEILGHSENYIEEYLEEIGI